MSLTYQRSRITGAGLVAAQYDLTLERQTIMDNILFIPGIANPVAEIRQLLFGQGQPGGSWIPTLSAAMIAANTFGSGVTDILDLSGNNNPFSQATPSSRGAWFREPKTGRRNIISNPSEDLATWTFVNVSGTASVTGNNVVFGASTVDRVISQAVTVVSGLQYTASITVSGSGQIRLFIIDGTGSTLTPLTITLTSTPTRYSVTATSVSSGGSAGLGIYNNASATPSSFTFFNAQFEQSATMTPYQRRGATAFDVTEAGQRDCFGVRADGIDDRYNTTNNVNFTATNKMTVFAAVRKRSDAARGLIVSHNENLDSRFSLESPDTTPTFRALYRSRGTETAAAITTSAAFTAPVNMVMTGESDIGSPFVRLRINGASVANVTVNQGTGNYANAALQLFHIASAGHFNGDMFALVVAGGSYPLSTIQRVERILSRITPTVNL
jgi:hypothetical protein